MWERIFVDLVSGAIELVEMASEGKQPPPEEPLREHRKRSRFAGEDPKNRMPARLTRGSLVGDAGEEADGRWSFVVKLPAGLAGLAGLAVIPRAPELPPGPTGAPPFDRRFAVLGEPPRVELLVEPVRRAWTAAGVDWSCVDGLLHASAPRFTVRWEMLEALDDGLDIAEALVARAETNAARLLEAVADPAWRVAAAAFDALVARPPQVGEEDALVQAYAHVFAGGGSARLRVHALARAADWPGVAREAAGLESGARSDAFGWLVAQGPTELAAGVAAKLLERRTGLDDARAWWVVGALERGEARIHEVVSPLLAERYLLELSARDDDLAEAAGELLARTGGASSVRALERREEPRAKAIALRIRARLGQGGLSVAGDTGGGLSLEEEP